MKLLIFLITFIFVVPGKAAESDWVLQASNVWSHPDGRSLRVVSARNQHGKSSLNFHYDIDSKDWYIHFHYITDVKLLKKGARFFILDAPQWRGGQPLYFGQKANVWSVGNKGGHIISKLNDTDINIIKKYSGNTIGPYFTEQNNNNSSSYNLSYNFSGNLLKLTLSNIINRNSIISPYTSGDSCSSPMSSSQLEKVISKFKSMAPGGDGFEIDKCRNITIKYGSTVRKGKLYQLFADLNEYHNDTTYFGLVKDSGWDVYSGQIYIADSNKTKQQSADWIVRYNKEIVELLKLAGYRSDPHAEKRKLVITRNFEKLRIILNRNTLLALNKIFDNDKLLSRKKSIRSNKNNNKPSSSKFVDKKEILWGFIQKYKGGENELPYLYTYKKMFPKGERLAYIDKRINALKNLKQQAREKNKLAEEKRAKTIKEAEKEQCMPNAITVYKRNINYVTKLIPYMKSLISKIKSENNHYKKCRIIRIYFLKTKEYFSRYITDKKDLENVINTCNVRYKKKMAERHSKMIKKSHTNFLKYFGPNLGFHKINCE